MTTLTKKAFGGLLGLFIAMMALLSIPAGTLHYWEAWSFLAVFFVPSIAITFYLMKTDPELLRRRLRGGPTAEKQTRQKIIQSITSLAFIAMLVVPALDHRFGWSVVPVPLVIAGDVLILLGFLIIFFVYKENSFASATIEIAPDQKVISTGLYAIVRHPMYFGGLLLFIGIPLSLGSWWGLVMFALMVPALIWRLVDEEKFLARNLPGYTAYQNKVRYHLIPYIW
jgi:protein-S-isoprenylcysteine O-methyltransferase Ste14